MNERVAKGLSWPEITEHLLLARLLVPSRKPLAPSRWKRDVELFFRHAASPAQWSELFEAGRKHCLDEGLVRVKPLALTAAGREACLAFWQIDPTKLPARLTWQIVLRAVIAPRALGVPRETFQTKEPAKALMLAVLRKGLRLPATVRTRTDLLNALAWRELGIESTAAFTPAAVVAQRLLRTDHPLQADEVVKNLAKTELIPSEKDLFRAAVQKWIADAADAADCATPSTADATANSTADSRADGSVSPEELVQFSAVVLEAARRSGTGRFGDSKIFISHVWRRLLEQPQFAAWSLPRFKERLVAAHRRQLLSLSRADLVERMDPRDVEESETAYLDARFHFIRL